MTSRVSRAAFVLGMMLMLLGTAFCNPCANPRARWMDSLKSSGIKSVDVAADFDLFPDGHLVLHIKDIRYFNDYVMTGETEIKKKLPEALENQLRNAATQAMQLPLQSVLTEKHAPQGRGDFSYPLYDDPCRLAAFFEPRVFGPTPLALRPVGKGLAVVAYIAATRSFSGKAQTRVAIKSDDGWLYICGPSGTLSLPFRKGENVGVTESNGYLTIESLEPNAHSIRLKMVQKDRFRLSLAR